MDSTILKELYDMIEERKDADPESSYVAKLNQAGTSKIAQKVGEEAVETCIEALQGDPEKLKQESADLLFHLMVLWSNQGIKPDDVLNILKERQGISGITEKENRKS